MASHQVSPSASAVAGFPKNRFSSSVKYDLCSHVGGMWTWCVWTKIANRMPTQGTTRTSAKLHEVSTSRRSYGPTTLQEENQVLSIPEVLGLNPWKNAAQVISHRILQCANFNLSYMNPLAAEVGYRSKTHGHSVPQRSLHRSLWRSKLQQRHQGAPEPHSHTPADGQTFLNPTHRPP